jgi:hypothetical protein
MSPARKAKRVDYCAAFPLAAVVEAPGPACRPANTDSSTASSSAHHPAGNATMSIDNGGRRVHRTQSHAVRLASRNALWQSRTRDSERRSTVFIRDRILFCVGLSVTRLQEGPRRPAPAPLTVGRLHHPSVVAGHVHPVRSAVWHRGSPRHGTADANGSLTRAKHRLRPGADRPRRTNVTHGRRSVKCIS